VRTNIHDTKPSKRIYIHVHTHIHTSTPIIYVWSVAAWVHLAIHG
jgi:hypothetical protein